MVIAVIVLHCTTKLLPFNYLPIVKIAIVQPLCPINHTSKSIAIKSAPHNAKRWQSTTSRTEIFAPEKSINIAKSFATQSKSVS